MPKFYFTFGTGMAHAHEFVIIHADNYTAARTRMFELYGDWWCSQHTEESWVTEDGQTIAEKYNNTLLAEYTLEEQIGG